MKNASILNENYMTYTNTVQSAFDDLNKELGSKFEVIEEAVNCLFAADELSTESAEYFNFKHNPKIKELLREDYESGLRAIMSMNKKSKDYSIQQAVKCAGLHQALFESAESKLECLNETFGSKSVLNETCDTVTADGVEVRSTIKKIIPLYEEALNKVNYILKTISNTPEDKATLVENLEILATVKTFIEEMK